jgi:hypothetical protein
MRILPCRLWLVTAVWLALVIVPNPCIMVTPVLAQQRQRRQLFFNEFIAMIRNFLNPILDSLIRSTCETLESMVVYYDSQSKQDVRLSDYMDCTCSAPYSVRDGLSTNLFCAMINPICFDPNNELFCGVSNAEINYNMKFQTVATKSCLEIETGIQLPILNQILSNAAVATKATNDTSAKEGAAEIITITPTPNLICFRTQTALSTSNLLKIDSCSIQIGNRKCQSCQVCASGRDIQFDCQNIVLTSIRTSFLPDSNDEIITIFGPKIGVCIGFNFITDPIRNILPWIETESTAIVTTMMNMTNHTQHNETITTLDNTTDTTTNITTTNTTDSNITLIESFNHSDTTTANP